VLEYLLHGSVVYNISLCLTQDFTGASEAAARNGNTMMIGYILLKLDKELVDRSRDCR
jgi:hypothetical protein